MSTEVKNETSEQEQENQVPAQNPFGDESWVEQPVKSEAPAPTEQVKSVSQETKKDDEEILDPKEWLKREFDTDDVTVIKAEREELKKLKEKNTSEITFANDQSKQIHELLKEGKNKEVREFLQNQEQIDELAALQVDKDNAADIIKLQMKLKNKQLSAKEIDFEYKQNYELPKEPVQKVTEDDDDFNERVAEWKEKCEIVETKRVIAAKLAQPELTNFKSELVLPEIQKGNQGQKTEPTPEELESFKKDKETFLQSAENSVSSFNGFNVQVKDKDVDYTVNYAPSQEEKTLVSGKLKEFTESGFDANSIFVDRWLNEDGKTMNVAQMTEDLSRIFMGKNSDQKLATDSANKRLDAYLKDKKQINVNEINQNGQATLEKDNTSETVKVQEFFWNQS